MKRTDICRGCGKEIGFIRTIRSKTVPVDPEGIWIRPDPKGDIFIREDGSTIIGFPAGDADDDPDSNLIRAYVSHFATCPEADSFRKRRKRDRRKERT